MFTADAGTSSSFSRLLVAQLPVVSGCVLRPEVSLVCLLCRMSGQTAVGHFVQISAGMLTLTYYLPSEDEQKEVC